MPNPFTEEQEQRLVKAFGGKPGDKLVKVDGGWQLTSPQRMEFSSEPTDPLQAQRIAESEATGVNAMLSEPNPQLRQPARQSLLGEQAMQPLNAFKQHALASAGPSAAALAAGLAVGGVAGRALPGPAKLAAPLLGMGSSLLTGHYANKLQQEFLTPEFIQQLERGNTEFPVASKFGDVLPGLVSQRPSIDGLMSAGRIARNITRAGGELRPVVDAAVKTGDLANTIGMAPAVGLPAYGAYKEYERTGEINPKTLGIDLAAGLGFTSLNKGAAGLANKIAGRPMFSHVGYNPEADAAGVREGLPGLDPIEFQQQPSADIPWSSRVANEVSPAVLEATQEYNTSPYTARKAKDPTPVRLAEEIARGREQARAEEADLLARRPAAEEETRQRELAEEQAQLQAEAKQAQDEQELANAIAKAKEQLFKQKQQGDVKMFKQRLKAQKKEEKFDPDKLDIEASRMETEMVNRAYDVAKRPDVDRAKLYSLLHDEKLGVADKLYALKDMQSSPIMPIVPDKRGTVAKQVEALLDPNSSRKAVLYTSGTPMDPVKLGLKRVNTQHGMVDYNPRKIPESEVMRAAQGEQFNATILGMSRSTKPGDPDAVAVTSSRPTGEANVQAEVSDSENLPRAIEAAQKADPGGIVEVKTPEKLIEERQTDDTPPQYSSESNKVKLSADVEAERIADELDSIGDDTDTITKALQLDPAISARVSKVVQARNNAGIRALNSKKQYSAGKPSAQESKLSADESSDLGNLLGTTLAEQGRKVQAFEDPVITTPDDATPRTGRFKETDGQPNEIEFSVKDPEAAPHETIHDVVSRLSPEGQQRLMDIAQADPGYQRALADNPDMTPAEYVAIEGGTALANQIKNKDFGLWRDMAVILRRATGRGNLQDSMRTLGNVFTIGAKEAGGSFTGVGSKIPARDVGPAGTYKRYPESELDPELNPPSVEGTKTKYSKHGFSTVDNIKDDQLRKSVRRAYGDKQMMSGEFRTMLEPNAKGIDVDGLVTKLRGGGMLTLQEKKLTKAFSDAAKKANDYGIARPIQISSKGYFPEVVSPEAVKALKDDLGSPTSRAIESELAKHWKSKEDAKAYVEFIHKNNHEPDSSFGPARKQAGLGLPAQVTVGGKTIRIRDNDAARAVASYATRLAGDISWHVNVERLMSANPDIRSDKYFESAKNAYSSYGKSPVLSQLSGVASSMVTGTFTGTRNLINLPQQAVVYGGAGSPVKLLKALGKIVGDPTGVAKRAKIAGTIVDKNQPEFNPNAESRAQHYMQKFRHAKRAIEGAAAQEYLSRMISHSYAEEVSSYYLAKAKAGDKEALAVLDRFAVDPNNKLALKQLTSDIGTAVEGVYDARELPRWLVDSPFGDLMGIHKWSISKANLAYKDILLPAKRGNLAPLVYAIATAAGVTIPASLKLNETLNKRKGNATLDEIKAAEVAKNKTLLKERTAWLTDKIVTAGLGGAFGNLANVAAQKVSGNDNVNALFIPLDEVAGQDLSKLISDTAQAIGEKEPTDEILQGFTHEVLKIMFQAAEPVSKQLDPAGAQRGSDVRDKAVYDKLVNEKKPSGVEANKIVDRRERLFRESPDNEEAMDQLGPIIDSYVEKYKLEPLMLRKQIEALKNTGVSSFPNTQHEFPQYYIYLVNAYGKPEADKLVERSYTRWKLSKLRRKVVPDVGGSKPMFE